MPTAPATANEMRALEGLLVNPAMCLQTALLVNPIRAAREAAGITQSDLAFALRISQPMLSRQEQPLRRVRPSSVARALDAIRRIQENRARPTISLEGVLSGYGNRLAESAARKPRDPIERRLLREAGDPVALKEREGSLRQGGERRRPPKRNGT
jgi:transcriptional regulator with XRE-family HTH domain